MPFAANMSQSQATSAANGKEAELAHTVLGTGQLRGRVRRRVKSFIKSFHGFAPDAETFAERLVEALLSGEAVEERATRTVPHKDLFQIICLF